MATKRRREILDAVASLREAGSTAQAVADGVEFWLDSSPRQVRASVATFQERWVTTHRILYKVRFARRKGSGGRGSRRSVTVVPTAPDSFASVVSAVSGVHAGTCARILTKLLESGVIGGAALAASEQAVRRAVDAHSSSEWGRTEAADLLAAARRSAAAEVSRDLRSAISSALSNGFDEAAVVRMVREFVVQEVMDG